MILAVHLEIDVQRRPACAEIGLPLQLHVATGHRQGPFAPVLVVEGDRGLGRIHRLDRHVEDATRLRVDGQEDRVGLLALVPQASEHHRHQIVVALRRAAQNGVEPARAVEVGGADELVLEPERVEEAAQHRVVVVPEAFVGSERIGNVGQRPLQVLAQHLRVGHVVGNLAHPVHVVGKADQPGRDIADHLEGPAYHGRARHLAEGADMRQTRGAIAGLEQDVALGGRAVAVAGKELAGLLEGPRLRCHAGVAQIGHPRSLHFTHWPY